MMSKQGDVALLNDPLAQELLQSTIPARLAYVCPDGSPRVVPIWFHWTGEELVFGSPPGAPKLDMLRDNPQVAITIDTVEWPYKVLMIRGSAEIEMVDGVGPEYALSAERYFGEEAGKGWTQQMGGMFSEMGRISVRPEWVGIMDFEQRFPKAIAEAMSG
jgi:hypothetical protein